MTAGCTAIRTLRRDEHPLGFVMSHDTDQPSNWERATLPPDETLRLILELIRMHLDLWGKIPSVAELRVLLRRPGA